MNLIYFEVLLICYITAILAEHYAYGSRFARNEQVVSLLTGKNVTEISESVKLEISSNQTKDEVNSNRSDFMVQQPPFNNASSETSPPNKDITIDNEASLRTAFNANSGLVDQYSRNESAINLFAQRVGHNLFQIAPSSNYLDTTGDKTQEGVLHKLSTMIWSPLSVYQALLPVFYAADGETKEELRQLLSLNLNSSDLNSNTSRTLSSVTGLFTRSDITLSPDYIQEVQKELKSVDVKTIDFSSPANAMNSVNNWVNESTKGLMTQAIDETQINSDTFMLIVNCVRFKSSWKTRFNEKLTKVSNFYGVNGVQKVQMMKQIGTQRFAKFPILFSSDYEGGETSNNHEALGIPFSVLEMPYADGEFTSLFILPDSTDKLKETMEYVEKIGVAEIRRMLDYSDVEVLMPRFKVKSDVSVEEALIQNGLKTLFNPLKANLSKFLATRDRSNNQSSIKNENARVPQLLPPPFLSNIIHRTIFETTEEGTAAAALTALSIIPLSALSHDRVYRFNLNRPFIVLLLKSDNTLVFQGVIADLIGQSLNDDDANEIGKHSIGEKDSGNNAPIRNSLLYPSESELKGELDKLMNAKGENEDGSDRVAPASSTKEELKEGEGTQLYANEQSSEDRAWWIPKRIPEYLRSNKTSNSSSSISTTVPTKDNDKVISTPEKVASAPAAQDQYLVIQFTKYQQPEPKDPNGIRFPATIPLMRNKVNIKPRYENHDNVKNSLIRWMYVH